MPSDCRRRDSKRPTRYSSRNRSKSITTALIQLLAQYLLLAKDEEMFKEWLKDEIEMKGKHLNDCSNCITEWSRAFM